MERRVEKRLFLSMGLYELRVRARNLGVRSPSSYKKEELIEKMLQIIDGQSIPHIKTSNRGRPPKSTKLPPEIAYDFSADNVNTVNSTKPDYFVDEFAFEGYLDVSHEIWGVKEAGHLFDNQFGFVMSAEKVKNCHLRLGDKISGIARNFMDGESAVIVEITKINDVAAESYKRDCFENMDICYPETPLKADLGADVLLGSRNLIIYENNKDLEEFINKLDKTENLYLILGVLEALPEQGLFYKNLKNAKHFAAKIAEEPQAQLKLVEFIINRAKRVAEGGNDVVLLIDNLNKIIKNQNSVSGRDINEFSDIMLCKRFFALARAFKGGSVTVLGAVNNKQKSPLEQAIIKEFECVADNVIKI